VGAVVAFFALGLQRNFTLEVLRANEQRLLALKDRSPLLFAAVYLLLYVAVTALSVPGDIPLTVGAGALFGLAEGTALVSFASALGATLAFLTTRFLFRDVVRQKLPARLEQINRGLERGGRAYLLSLRLVPAVPFVLINTLFGVTDFPVRSFYWISQVGMLPATLVYVNAGTQLGRIHSLSGILSPAVLVSLLLLTALPLAARAVSACLTRSK
jgi:uncharacterized membrane protein YdjX (TVP38/TMEM64 family)